jgi:hypothetical protein
MDDGEHDEQLTGRLTAVAMLGFLLFVPPLLALFDRQLWIFGLPALWVYIFVAWAVVIVLAAVVIGRR